MAIPEIRPALRHIDNVRNAITVVSVWFYVVLIVGGAVWLDTLVELPDRLRRSWARCTPASPSSCTSRPTSSSSPTSGGTTGSALGSSPTPSSPRCSSTAGSTSPTTRTSSGPTSPTWPSTARTPAPRPRCADGSSATRSASRVGRTSSPWSRASGTSPFRRYRALHLRRPGGAVGRRPGWPPDAGGSTRCCGGSRG